LAIAIVLFAASAASRLAMLSSGPSRDAVTG
jgi:hypothetical protein